MFQCHMNKSAISFGDYALRLRLRTVLFSLVVLALGRGSAAADGTASSATAEAQSCPAVGDAAIIRLLRPIREQHDLPAMAALLLTSKGITAVGAVGVRKRGTGIAVTLDDQWHLGSDTKAMTAALVARLVERNQLRWDSTLAEVFPDLAGEANPALRGVTLTHLLSHRAGVPANLSLGEFRGEDAPAERLRAVRETLAKAALHPPGSNYLYSNLGYILAGAMIERVTGKSWEQAMRDDLFIPLRMTNTGFGGTGTPGQLDQPWPHSSNGQPMPRNGPTVDNPPVLGPAGRVHATLQDWAKFIQDQLRGAQDKPGLLTAASYQRLHSPTFGGDYGLGWLVVERPWGGGKVLHHAGDNTMNHANVWLAPRRDFAVLVCVNQGGPTAAKACDEAVGALIKWQQQNAPSQPAVPGKAD
jgi:CubicO group peptidase (beta-lactamase class C family)